MKYKFFVPFETAVKLKEKGYAQFDSNRSIMYGDDYYYDKDGVIAACSFGLRNLYGDDFKNAENDYILAPKYYEVLDWLRDQDKTLAIDITVGFNPIIKKHICFCQLYHGLKIDARGYPHNESIYRFESQDSDKNIPEDVLNRVILKALELL